MGQTLQVKRIGRTAVTAIELVYSPDDGGYYLSNSDFLNKKSRVSVKTYATEDEAIADWGRETVEWEEWS